MPAKSPGLAQHAGSTAVANGTAARAAGTRAEPAHRHLGLALVIIAAAQLMVVLDRTSEVFNAETKL